MWILHVASKTFSACCPHYPGWRGQVLRSVALLSPAAFPYGRRVGSSKKLSRPAQGSRSFGLRFCTSVVPRTSPEASAGRSLVLGRSSGYRVNRQFPRTGLPPDSLRDPEGLSVNLHSAHLRPPFVTHCHPNAAGEGNSSEAVLRRTGWFLRPRHNRYEAQFHPSSASRSVKAAEQEHQLHHPK